MRRLLALISALLFLEMVFMAGLSPLLPQLQHEFDLSTSEVGALLAMYAVGAIAGAFAAIVLAARRGPKSAALISLVVFAASSLAFGVAGSYAGLLASRLVQGFAGAICWSAGTVWLLEVAPPQRRGELLGLAFGISELGAIAGPVIGGVAAAAGRSGTFAAIAALSLGLALATTRFAGPPRAAFEKRRLGPMLSSPRVRTAMGIAMLPAILLAAISVLGPLQQHDLGAGAGEIAATFALAALAGLLIRPYYGRWSDRRGPLLPVRVGLLANVPFVLALPWLHSRPAAALFICCILILIGVLWAPLMVMLSDACLAAGLGQIMAVTAMNLTWPPGNVIGAAGGAAVAQAAGERWTWAILAASLLTGFLVLGRRREPLPSPAYAREGG